MNDSIEHRTKTGILWSGLFRVVTQFISLVFGVILARLLVPQDFGTVAGIIIFIEVAHSIVGSGVVTAIVQRKELREEHCSTAFTIQMVLSVVAYLTLVFISAWVGSFLRSATAGEVMVIMALSVLLMPFLSIPTALLRREMDFRAAGIAETVQQLCSGATAVMLAYLGWGVWSLVYGRVLGWFLKSIQVMLLAKWWPRLDFSRDIAQELYSFGGRVVAANLLNDIANNIAYLLVGRFLGPQQLGFYYKAYYLMNLPTTRVTEAINTVFLSTFSGLQGNDAAFKQSVLKALYWISLLVCPISVGLFWVAPSFVHTIYGQQWTSCVLPLQIMCFAGIFFSLEPVAVSAITARGYIGLEVQRQFFYALMVAMGVVVGSYWGIVGISVGVLFTSIILAMLLQRLLNKISGITWYEIVSVMKPAVVGCGTMSLALLVSQHVLKEAFPIYSSNMLIISVIVGSISYITSFLLACAKSRDKFFTDSLAEWAVYFVWIYNRSRLVPRLRGLYRS